jgi:hypothetical protein
MKIKETIRLFGQEIKLIQDDKMLENEIWLSDKNEKIVGKIIGLSGWQVIASGEVKGKYRVYVGDKSIYNIENKILSYQGKDIEIRVKEE